MFILKKGHQPGVYVPLRALFLVYLFIRLAINEKLCRIYALYFRPRVEQFMFSDLLNWLFVYRNDLISTHEMLSFAPTLVWLGVFQ